MTFLPSPALVAGTGWAVMYHPRHWLCHTVGRRHVPPDGGESCGWSQDHGTIWTPLHKAVVKCGSWKSSLFMQFSWVSTGQQNPTSLTPARLKDQALSLKQDVLLN